MYSKLTAIVIGTTYMLSLSLLGFYTSDTLRDWLETCTVQNPSSFRLSDL